MIYIESLSIEEFRGIRKLKLDFGKKTFAIYGPNGTGKSGVVDALEFVITGNISRLSGQGTSGITLKQHAPHVDHRDTPDRARVILNAFIPMLGQAVSIERRVNAPHIATITPDDPEVRKIISELARHPEFALTRREIIKYVLAPAGERSKEVQALLRIDEIEKVRLSLQTIQNSIKGVAKQRDQDVLQAQIQLLRALGLPSLKKEDLLRSVNQRRVLLGLEELADLGASTSIKSGIVGGGVSTKILLSKKQATVDLNNLKNRKNAEEPPHLKLAREKAHDLVITLQNSPSLLGSLRREGFLQAGLGLIDGESCPFCGTEWEPSNLRAYVERKLREAEDATKLKQEFEKTAQPIMNELRDAEETGKNLIQHAQKLPSPLDLPATKNWIAAVRGQRETVTSINHLDQTKELVKNRIGIPPDDAAAELDGLGHCLRELPDPSQEDEAKEYLTLVQERLDVYREAKRQQDRSKKQAELAEHILATFNQSANAVLTSIYRRVEDDFGRFYRLIHREDEAAFTGKLIPSLGKLGFDVDFYGRGHFPPGAYHSEGHQDSMGVCLYLALMKHTLADQFKFAILDDVLMSVDSGHRREVCALLKSQFPETQFIITTHDEIWLHHMKTEQLVTSKASVQFRRWTVDDGPVVWEGTEVWDQIENELNESNIPGAAGTLRRYLEYISSQISYKLRARVEIRGDAQYELGELMPAVITAFRKLLARAQDAANSWGQKEEQAKLAVLQDEFSNKVSKSNVEAWPINKSIHYNEWATLGKEDFEPVVKALRDLLNRFRCDQCSSFIYVTPTKGQIEALRCDCGNFNFNLKKK